VTSPIEEATDRLDFLAMAFYALASLVALLCLVPLLLAGVEKALEETALAGAPSPLSLHIVLAVLLVVAGLAMAALLVAGGRALQTRTRIGVARAAAAVACLAIPFGTMLGLYTWQLLERPETLAAGGDEHPAGPPSGAPGR